MTAPEKVMMPRYRCVHCRRSWANRATALQHSARCWYDPANRACKTCAYFAAGYSDPATGARMADSCAIEVRLPAVERHGHLIETLAVNCEDHSLRRSYMHPDVLDVLDAATDAAH